MTTAISGREPSPGTPARPRGEPPEPVRRAAAIAAARSTPALTGAQRPSQGAGRGASRGSWEPPSWTYDYTRRVDSHATRRESRYCTVNLFLLVSVPPGVTTAILPLDAPTGTTAVICVSDTTLNVTAAVAPNRTTVAPVKPVPVIVTVAPTGPEPGEKLVMLGAMTRSVAVVAVPFAVVTDTRPDVAAGGTTAVTFVSLATLNVVALMVPPPARAKA